MRFLILLVFFISIYLIWSYQYEHRSTDRITYFRFDKKLDIRQNDSKELAEPFQTIFKEYQINESRECDIYFFTLLTDYIQLYKYIIKQSPKYIYSLRSIDILANKALLPKVLSANNYLLNRFTPKTYVLSNKNDLERLKSTFDQDKLYILKKNVQRQKGCTITNNLNYIKTADKNDYVVCQELLMNPYTISGHKINLRCYMLVIVKKDVKCMLYNNGFMYYTPKKFDKKSTDKDVHITTGYIDRKIYDENPLTIKDLYKSLGMEKGKRLQKNLIEMFEYIAYSYEENLYKYDSNHHTNFVILGCDVAVDNKLDCKIMELNKGPDLSYKDKRDKEVKYNMVKDMLYHIGLTNHINKNFITVN